MGSPVLTQLGKLMLYQLSYVRAKRVQDSSVAGILSSARERAKEAEMVTVTKTDTGLEEIAQALVAEGKGILAADESDGTIKKRFDSIGVGSTEETRRAYRELLFTTEGVEEYISGVILYDETIRQSASDGTPFPELLASRGIIPGI
jgi:hypothetical protein